MKLYRSMFRRDGKKGYIYKGKKAVYWCPHCETALAEAEIEYGEEKSPAIFVKMPLVKDNGMLPEAAQGKPAYIVIWTTTPWTMPANVAIALHPDFEYAWVECEGEILFMAKEMLEAVGKVCKKTSAISSAPVKVKIWNMLNADIRLKLLTANP